MKGKSALLAELLVQLVFIRKTRTSCRCHDGVCFFSLLGRSSESGMLGASLRTGEPRDTVSAHLRTSGRFSCWPARAHAHLRTHAHARRRVHKRAITHGVRLTVGLCAGRTDSLNTTQAGDVSSPHDALPLIKKGRRGEKKWIGGGSEL